MGKANWGAGQDVSTSVAVDANGNVYTTGEFAGTVDFDPGPGIYNLSSLGGYFDVFVSKLNSSGDFQWAKQVGGPGSEEGSSIAVDASGFVFVSGTFEGTANFNPGNSNNILTSIGNADMFYLKLDNSGNFLWAKQIGGVGAYVGDRIAVDPNGNVYTIGLLHGTVDVDPGPSYYYLSTGTQDIFVSKLDTWGNFIWAVKMGGNGNNGGLGVAVNTIGNVYATGWFTETVDFDPGPGIYNITALSPPGGIDAFVLKLGEPIIYENPKLLLSKAVLNVNEFQVITGRDFTPNGLISLSIKNEFGEIVGNTIPITYIFPGKFTYTLPITNSFKHGEYKVYSIDNSTGKTTPIIKFKVNNPVQRKLWINKPLGTDSYLVNQIFQIQWGDYIDKTSAIGKSGLVQKSYKIELSNNNGSTWTITENVHLINNAKSGINNNYFSTNYKTPISGTYIIRITDNDNASDFNISDPFIVTSSAPGGFSYTYEWDYSCPKPIGILGTPNPIGLAADGTARIFIKLSRDALNPKAVKSIQLSILPDGDNYSGSALLGKIMYANNISYDTEANNATITSETKNFSTPSAANDFWFWLVAPDDFTHDPSNQKGERKIKLNLLITYFDNSIEPSIPQQPSLTIVRPPLFLVHGINADAGAFKNTQYNVDGTRHNFDDGIIKNPVWKDAYRLNLYNYESFATNAEVILGIIDHQVNYYNSILYHLALMHNAGYACNRVDYVAHSMGGCIARTIINLYVDSYKPPSTATFKNYNQGFINKLITINTPHNGAYLADLLMDKYGTGLDNFLISSARSLFHIVDGFFVPDGSSLGVPHYKVSPAVKDLQAKHGGIRFKKTIVKNHLIGSDLDQYDNTSEFTLRRNNYLYQDLYSVLLPSTNIFNYINDNYQNKEYLSDCDFVVPKSSQLPGKTFSDYTNIYDSPDYPSTASIVYGITESHSSTTDDPAIGTRIMHLLNAPISTTSGYFADEIVANTNPNGDHTYRTLTTSSIQDSTINYYDTLKIKIQAPISNSSVIVDSSVLIQFTIKDTAGLQLTRLFFQGHPFNSNSKALSQLFNIKVNPDAIGKDLVIAEAIYDSLGYTIIHTDSIMLIIKSLDTLKGFYLSTKSQFLNPRQFLQPTFNAVYTHYIGILNNNIDSLGFSIADTNVIRYDSVNYQFVAKDTGTTYIVFNYKGFLDTSFVYISESQENLVALPIHLISFNGLAKPTYNLLEWKAVTEINFSHFILQSSLDGNIWTKVAKVNSKSNITATNDYNYSDSAISNKIIFYRLLLVDIDGTTKTSNIVAIRRSNNLGLKIFPNPVTKSEVFIDFGNSSFSSQVIINVLELSGKIVKTINQSIQNNSPMRLNLYGLRPSVYMLKIQKGNDIQTVKLVVLE